MPLSTILILTYIVSMFAAFILALGGVSLSIFLSDMRARKAARRAAPQARHHATLRAV